MPRLFSSKILEEMVHLALKMPQSANRIEALPLKRASPKAG
jgi:hypothetical protein